MKTNLHAYKFRSFNKDNKNAIENDFIWASNVAELNDPFEAMVDQSDMDNFIKLISLLANTDDLKKNWDELMEKRFLQGIFSLSKNWQNELLWAHYADSHKGFCIEYDVNRLIANYDAPFSRVMHVKYDNTIPKIKHDFLQKSDKNFVADLLNGQKSKAWEYEDEVRIVYFEPAKKLHPPSAIKSITIGHRASKTDEDFLFDLVKHKSFDLYKIQLGKNSYAMHREKIFEATPSKFQLAKDINQIWYFPFSKDKALPNEDELLWAATHLLLREDWIDNIDSVFVSTDYPKKNSVVANITRINGYPIKPGQISYDINFLRKWIDSNPKDEYLDIIRSKLQDQ